MAIPITDYVNMNDYVMIVQDGCIKHIRFEDFIKGISLGGFSVCEAWLNCVGGIGVFPGELPPTNTPPTMEDLFISLQNREQNRIFTTNEFLDKYYDDGIIQGFDYQDVTQKTISIINICSVPFNILGMDIFSDITSGSNFVASIKDFSIGANQTINIPVYYNGIYLGANLSPNYQITINANSAIYSLTVSVPQINNPPVAEDIIVDLNNREDKILDINMFLNHFSDIDGDTLAAVIIEGNTINYTLNGQPIVSGAQIPRSAIESNYLVFNAPDTNDYNEDSTIWKAVDSAGSISI